MKELSKKELSNVTPASNRTRSESQIGESEADWSVWRIDQLGQRFDLFIGRNINLKTKQKKTLNEKSILWYST
jgi:hypothetical protein